MLKKGQFDISDLNSTGRDNKPDYLKIALSVKASEYPDRLEWAEENDFALEYTPDPLTPELIKDHVIRFIKKGVPVRFHTRFFDFELGNEDINKAQEALTIHKQVIDAIISLGEKTVTVHLNLNKSVPFSTVNAVSNLIELTHYAGDRGVVVCLENLKKGPASNPDNIVAWAGMADSMITLDIGHAISSQIVQSGGITVTRIIDLFSRKLNEVHMYGKEEDRHYPIDNITSFEEPVMKLLKTGCRWWTIELDDYMEALSTRKLLTDYLNKLRKEKNE
jgi:sugar phosphate isomerase/epimerase